MHKGHEPLPESTERVGRGIVGAAIAVHRALGPGLLELAYEICVAHELERRGSAVLRQMALPVVCEAAKLDQVSRRSDGGRRRGRGGEIDCRTGAVYEAQLLTVLNLSGRRLGFLISFNVVLPKQGIRRMIL